MPPREPELVPLLTSPLDVLHQEEQLRLHLRRDGQGRVPTRSANIDDFHAAARHQVFPQSLELRHEHQFVERPHKVPPDQRARLGVIPQHRDAEGHQLVSALFEVLRAVALLAVAALGGASRERSEAVLGEEAEEREDGRGEELGLLGGKEGGVLADELEQAGVPGEGHAAEEGEEQGREPRRGRAG